MLKKLILLIVALVPLFSTAQPATGTWERIFSYGGTPSRVIESPNKVYVVAQGCLSAYDKQSGEIIAYTTSNSLSDNSIGSIYYNLSERYLMIVYSDYNLDLLYDDGRVFNMPEIKDAILNPSRQIYDVAFADGKAYLATDFGLVIIDDQTKSVVESGIYDVVMSAVAVVGNRIVVGTADGRIMSAPVSGHHNLFSAFSEIGSGVMTSAEGLSNGKMYAVIDGLLNTVSFSASGITKEELGMNGARAYKITPNKTGYFVHNATGMVLLDRTGNRACNVVSLPTEIRGNALGCYNGLNSVWAASSAGIGEFVYADGAVTVRRERFVPEGICASYIGNIRVANDGSIFFSEIGQAALNGGFSGPLYVSKLTPDGKFENVTPAVSISNTYNMYPDMYDGGYLVGARAGMYKVKEDLTSVRYTNSNTSFGAVYGSSALMIKDMRFDPDGNLWVHQYSSNATTPCEFHMIRGERWKDNPVKADWKAIRMDNSAVTHPARMAIGAKSGCVFLAGNSRLGVYDTKKTWSDLSDDDYRCITSGNLIDPDGVSMPTGYLRYVVEDLDGRLWAGGVGIFYIEDPLSVFNSSFNIVRPKVPRNDGTNLADILLDGVTVYWIAVDANNRKWIATNGSGLYLVNEDGTEILQNFTTENSDIPSNTVLCVECDPNSNKVYVGTDAGLAVYASDGTAAYTDYSEVYAYPNPVTPDYTGWITVTGLMDNSLVKIADAAGNVFFSGRSEGGMIVWDGCDTSGRRVKTGVYFVMASQNSTGNSGAVTKILVIN